MKQGKDPNFFFCIWISISLSNICWKDFSYWMVLESLKKFFNYINEFIFLSYPSPFIWMFVLWWHHTTLITVVFFFFFDYCSFVICFEVRKFVISLFFFSRWFWLFGAFCVSIYLLGLLFVSAIGILIEIAFNLWVTIGTDILTILSSNPWT